MHVRTRKSRGAVAAGVTLFLEFLLGSSTLGARNHLSHTWGEWPVFGLGRLLFWSFVCAIQGSIQLPRGFRPRRSGSQFREG